MEALLPSVVFGKPYGIAFLIVSFSNFVFLLPYIVGRQYFGFKAGCLS